MTNKNNQIEVRGGKVNNLKNIDVDIPLNKFVAISGLSGSGKSSLAMGILYAEGSRRYLEALSTYTRRRIGQNKRSDVQSVKHIPSALALRQRPSIPNERSTVGSLTEVFNLVRLIFSRLGSIVCPNGHRMDSTLEIAQAMDYTDERMGIVTCPTCHIQFMAKSAEDYAFNSGGACPKCNGLGVIRTLNEDLLIVNDNLTIREGAVRSWHLPGRNFMPTVVAHMGVRIDIPYKNLTVKEKNIVMHGEKKHISINIPTKNGRVFHMDNALYENAYNAIYDSLKTRTNERSIAQINKFFHFSTCPLCHGSRLNPELLTTLVAGLNIAQVGKIELGKLLEWEKQVKAELPSDMQTIAATLFREFDDDLRPLLELGLDYLSLDRNGNTLSTGELQRIQLARTLRTETTGVLYVLDEPSIGLHPDNIKGLLHVFRSLIDQGNSIIVVDHEVDLIKAADWVIEIGPGSGDKGGQVIATGTPRQLTQNPKSKIGPFIDGTADIIFPKTKSQTNEHTTITVKNYFNLKNVTAKISHNQINAVTGFSGAGKTSLILDSLVPAIKAQKSHEKLPPQVSNFQTTFKDVVSVDSSPVGKNIRSTVATYTKIMDNFRNLFAKLPAAKKTKYTIGNFSYNNKVGACPRCGGTGKISLDIQFLPDLEETCPICRGGRFNPEIQKITWHDRSIVDLLDLSVEEAVPIFKDIPPIEQELELLTQVGLSYLKLGESTPSLSGGEAQRLKLVKHLNKKQQNTLFVFDEPTIGLHPLDVQTLLLIIQGLKEKGGTIIIITHDLDLMINADRMIDLGPRGGTEGGEIVATGKPLELAKNPKTLTTKYLAEHATKFHLI